MMGKALETIQKYQMFSQGSKVSIALSGGADSVALLHFLCSLRDEWGLEVSAVHLNHNLRGGESDRDEAFVRNLCKELSVKLSVESAKVAELAKQAGESLEVCGRRLRYDLFRRTAEETGGKIALAHTLSDNAETVLINLIRGTALRGLSGIPPVREYIIRPLIACTRQEIEDYCRQNNLDYVTDSTNSSDDYTRNRVRRRILPLLEAENPQFLAHTARMTELLRADADYLDQLTCDAANTGSCHNGMGRQEFLALPPALRGRVLAKLLRKNQVEPSAELVAALEDIVCQGKGKRQITGNLYFVCINDVLVIEKKPVAVPPFALSLPAEEIVKGRTVEVYQGKSLKMLITGLNMTKKSQYFQKKVLTYCLDYDRIRGIVIFRQKMPGDKLRPLGRGCTKTLKNLFQEAKTPAGERDRYVVAADAAGPFWVEGIGPDERVAVTPSTKRVMILEVWEVPHG